MDNCWDEIMKKYFDNLNPDETGQNKLMDRRCDKYRKEHNSN